VEKALSELCSTTCSLGDIGLSLSLCFHFLSDVATGALPVLGAQRRMEKKRTSEKLGEEWEHHMLSW
jgi:hypothetical protein